MEKVLKIGIIGCGGIANGKHMPALKQVKGVEMVAFCDIVEERAVKAAKDYGTPDAKVYVDYKELLKDESIDVVHVCTPNREHSFITIDALEAGKHVYCEKPMAKNYAEAQKMVETSEKTGRVLNIGYQNRYRPDSLYLKEMCKAVGIPASIKEIGAKPEDFPLMAENALKDGNAFSNPRKGTKQEIIDLYQKAYDGIY